MGVKGAKYPAEPLSAAEVRSLLAVCDRSTLTGARNYALVVLLWRTGLRCSEALDLRPSDVDSGAGTVRVLNGKGRKARTVGIDDAALEVLDTWLAARSAAGIGDGPLFCTRAGGRLANRYVRALMARLGEKAGVQHRVHAHGLRHSMAVELRKEGWDIPLISRQLGHSSIATTAIYVDHLFPAEVVGRARARVWG
jgi:site-specific recombinase XerD